jgi:hypothetical protein
MKRITLLNQDNELTFGPILFHIPMGFYNFIKLEDAVQIDKYMDIFNS